MRLIYGRSTRILKAQGASWVGVSEPTATRSRIAKSCGADVVFDPMTVDIVEEVLKATSGGVDVVSIFHFDFGYNYTS